VAADAGGGAAAFGHAGGGVVRAARAEIGLPYGRNARLGEKLLLEVEKREPLAELRSEGTGHPQLFQSLSDGAGHHGRRMLVVRGQEPASRGLAAAAAPFAAVVELADHARRAHAFLPVVELLLDLVLDELALLL